MAQIFVSTPPPPPLRLKIFCRSKSFSQHIKRTTPRYILQELIIILTNQSHRLIFFLTKNKLMLIFFFCVCVCASDLFLSLKSKHNLNPLFLVPVLDLIPRQERSKAVQLISIGFKAFTLFLCLSLQTNPQFTFSSACP